MSPSLSRAARYLLGVLVLCVGAVLGVRSGLGAGPYDALLVALSSKLGVSFWVSAWLMQAFFIAALLRLRSRIRPTHLVHSLLFGPVISVLLSVVPSPSSLLFQVVYLLAALSMLSVGLSLYLGAAWMSGLGDALFDAAAGRFALKSTQVRTTFDVFCVSLAWMGGGPVGVGTVLLALGVGPVLAVLSDAKLPESFRGLRLSYARRFLRDRGFLGVSEGVDSAVLPPRVGEASHTLRGDALRQAACRLRF